MEEGKGKVRRRQRRRFTDEYKAQTVKLVETITMKRGESVAPSALDGMVS
jgi:transposase-like protein